MREAAGGRRDAEGGERNAGDTPSPFARVMADQGMVAPDALAKSMRQAAASFDGSLTDCNETLRAAEELLDQVLKGACETRESALDLLTVDALVTRAMQIAARDPKSFAEFPQQAMKRMSTR